MPGRRRPSSRRARVVHTPSHVEPKSVERGPLWPAFVWGAGTALGLGLLVGLLLVFLEGGVTHGTRWAFIGTVILLCVLTLAAGVKAAEAFVNWKEPGSLVFPKKERRP